MFPVGKDFLKDQRMELSPGAKEGEKTCLLGSDGGWEKGSGIIAFNQAQGTGALLLGKLVSGSRPPLHWGAAIL